MKELTDDDLIAIARQAALDSTHRYSYMPAMPEDAAQWAPHRWVIEAMRAILAARAGHGHGGTPGTRRAASRRSSTRYSP